MQTHVLKRTQLSALLIGAAFLLIGFVPLTAAAATTKPSCTLTVTTDQGEAKITKDGDVMLLDGEELTIKWAGKNADEATLDDEEVDTSDSKEFSPSKKTTYEFEFKNGSKKATCEVTVHVVEAEIDIDTLASDTAKPTISGEASGLKKVNLTITKEASRKAVFEKKNISVKKGEWSVKLSKTLADGTYNVTLTGDKKYDLNVIGEATLTVDDGESEGKAKEEKKNSSTKKSNGMLTVNMLPLGMGGSATAGDMISAVIVQVKNPGKEAVHVTGFGVRQTGSANVNVITELSSLDNLGESRASGKASFKDGVAIAPANATIPPGGFKLFTVKAQLGTNTAPGTSIVLDIVSVQSNGKSVTGGFPIRGNIWNIVL